MNEAADEKKPPGKIAGFFSAVFRFPARVLALSLAARATIVISIFLVAIVITAWVIFRSDPNSVPWRHAMTPSRILAIICLLFVIPLVAYRVLKLWLEGEASQFPEIDFAWKAGIAALERNGLGIRSTPIFLVIGSTTDRQERSLLDAAQRNLRVREVPVGPAPLHWYADPDAIYLFCSDASWLSALASLEDQRVVSQVASQLSSLESPSGLADADEDSVPVPPTTPAPSASRQVAPPSDPTRGTIMLESYMAKQMAQSPVVEETPEAGSGNRGTMMLQGPVNLGRAPAAAAATYRPTPMSESAPVLLAPQDSAEQLQRLQYVCQLLRRARQPLCGLNGVLTLLPFELLQGSSQTLEEMQRALRADLGTIQRTLELRCPVTALVIGMEKESGFRELVRRVGQQRALVQRFGQRFFVRSVATTDEMVSLCSHVCGAFEDWVYTLFREAGALTRPGNTRLYGLLCKVRCHLKGRLQSVLSGGFGHDNTQSALDEPLLFSGCYFAAAGESDDRQAFVKGVFDKLSEEQEEVEWTRLAMVKDRRYLWLAYTGLVIDAGLIAALGLMAATRWIF